MYPILLEFGFLKVFTYGLLVATGFLVAILFSSSRAKGEGLDPQKVLDLCFYVMVSALLGARLLYVIVEYQYFFANPLEIFKFWKGGLVFYGGLIFRCSDIFMVFTTSSDARMENSRPACAFDRARAINRTMGVSFCGMLLW